MNTISFKLNEVSNATGCSSIYGGSAPATPYCRNYRSGFGPAWANSLFEDNAEFGLGMATATRQMRDRVERIMKEGLACDCCSAEIKALFTEWIENRENTLKTKEIADKLIPLMEACQCDICKQLLELRHSLVKKSQWIFGGDGWGYDIGFGGLDHVLASGEDVCQRLRTPLNKSNEVSNVVVDTEVYSCYGCEHLNIKSNEVSNTGGQSSKEQNFQWTFCPAGAIAKLSAEPTAYHRDFIMGEVRYCRRLRTQMKSKYNEVSNSLMKTFPQEAEVPKAANTRKNRENVNEQLFVATERNAKLRYEGYKKLSEM